MLYLAFEAMPKPEVYIDTYRRWVPWKEAFTTGRCLVLGGWRVYPELWDWRLEWISETNRYWRFRRFHVGPFLVMRMDPIEA